MWTTSLTGSSIDTHYAFNSSGGGFGYANPGQGDYFVAFANLGAITNPTVDVTPYGTWASCFLDGKFSFKGNYEVEVVCVTPIGLGAQNLLDVIVAQPGSRVRGVLDYATVLPSGRLARSPVYNSSHRRNHARRLGVGRYEITMPGPATKGTTGTVKVSGVGLSTSGSCELAGWHGTRTGQVIDVGCFSSSGVLQDRGSFSVTYARGTNLMGLNGVTTADAYANRPAAPLYHPATQFDSHRGARITVKRIGQGRYDVFLVGSGGPWHVNGGDVQVSAVGTIDEHCIVDYWTQGPSPFAAVSCTDNSGHPIDARFTIQWVVA